MTKRIQKLVMTVAALAAFALGGAVFAQAQTTPKASEKTPAVDTDNVQSGDQTTPDVSNRAHARRHQVRNAANSTTTTTTDTGSAQSGNQSTPDTGTTSETSGENPGSESAPGNDGPSGHADEPGNPTADHQFSGTE